ncbi:MAG: TrmH family RNA methyltransferase [Eubacteriales bacterium]|nr:TrmH family RNA methyltransferase [Eubacteriales bacterium]
MTNKIKPYKKEFDCSYTLGASVTIELLKIRPDIVDGVYIHSSYRDGDGLSELCGRLHIPCVHSDKAFNIVSPKENCFVMGVVRKYTDTISRDEPHVVLVNPSDMGNLGTIIRTMAGMNLKSLAVIEPAADIWHPKTIRAGMGAVFHLHFEKFNAFDEYREKFPQHVPFPFMLSGAAAPEDIPPCPLFSLVFGNEAHGLDESFSHIGRCVRIPSNGDIDSFNLSVAAGIGMYEFGRRNNLI